MVKKSVLYNGVWYLSDADTLRLLNAMASLPGYGYFSKSGSYPPLKIAQLSSPLGIVETDATLAAQKLITPRTAIVDIRTLEVWQYVGSAWVNQGSGVIDTVVDIGRLYYNTTTGSWYCRGDNGLIYSIGTVAPTYATQAETNSGTVNKALSPLTLKTGYPNW